MNTIIVAVLLGCIAMVLADGYGYEEPQYAEPSYGTYEAPSHGSYHEQPRYYQPGFRRGYNGISAVYNNAVRQIGVNQVAKRVGSGLGTAPFYGVPGTGKYFPGYRQY